MQITDPTISASKVDEAGEVNDGFFVFTGQGSNVIEMIKYSGCEVSPSGHTFFWEMYEIIVSNVITERGCGLDLTELSQFPSNLEDQYVQASVVYFDNGVEAHAHLGVLIATLNHY